MEISSESEYIEIYYTEVENQYLDLVDAMLGDYAFLYVLMREINA